MSQSNQRDIKLPRQGPTSFKKKKQLGKCIWGNEFNMQAIENHDARRFYCKKSFISTKSAKIILRAIKVTFGIFEPLAGRLTNRWMVGR